MSKSTWRFKQTELQRLFKALTSMGSLRQVEVRADGRSRWSLPRLKPPQERSHDVGRDAADQRHSEKDAQ